MGAKEMPKPVIDINPALLEHHERTIGKMAAEIAYLKSRQLVRTSPEMVRDGLGMTPQHWRELLWENDRERLRQRWSALKAIWYEPATPTTCFGRGDEFNWWNAACATLALLLGRFWGDADEARWKRRLGAKYIWGRDVAFFDNHQSYFGWSHMAVKLYPGLRVEIFSDGE